ncbi:MAG: helix-turn-helix domain-containing protein [Candidatus Thiodiazotropha endolucinida]|nr:helix-turn-helix domain-containing protein [Candidatus Thiodiazotropha taylori]MCW4318768.1 helix-turn-helix domain-containing protein [Candidatus Thiodiazotropha taylori]
MDATELLKMLETLPSGKRILAEEKLIIEASEKISEILRNENVSKSELARRLGVNRASISKMLNGSQNMTLRSYAAMAYALGWKATIGLTHNDDKHWKTYETAMVRPYKIYESPIDIAANDEWTNPILLSAGR